MVNYAILLLYFCNNGEYMKSKRFKSTKLSTYKEVETGYKPWYYYDFAYFLYTLCVPSMSRTHPFESLRKIAKIQTNFSTAEDWVINFPEGVSPLCAGMVSWSISKSQSLFRFIGSGLGWPIHWRKRDCKSWYWQPVPYRRSGNRNWIWGMIYRTR